MGDQSGQMQGDHLILHNVKVVDRRDVHPEHPTRVKIGDLASLVGYDLAPAAADLKAGRQFSLTLYYRVERPTTKNYTRSLQLISPDFGIVAQRDDEPQEGQNPTNSWQPGEIVADTVTLDVALDAQRGRYTVALCFYDSLAGFHRLPLLDDHQKPIPNDQYVVLDVLIGP